MQVPVLTYHSQNIGQPVPEHNDHQSLREDLAALHDAGWSVVPLRQAVDSLLGRRASTLPERCVSITFDDGCDMDVRDVDFPGAGPQRGFLGVMQDFVADHGRQAQPALHATSFVIASPHARATIDRKSLFAQGWISDDWWRPAEESGLMAIENHGWDHFHPDVHPPPSGDENRFDTLEECERQVVESGRYIEGKTGRRPQLFAYPFGDARPFLRDRYLRARATEHGCVAAFGTRPGPMTAECDPWDLPRYVCGRDWRRPRELLRMLGG